MELTTIKGGLNRLRTKGAAPNDSLYDLLNGYVTEAKTVNVRPGTFRRANLPQTVDGTSLTKGLVTFGEEMFLFSTQAILEEDIPLGFQLAVLAHPGRLNGDGSIIELRKIHFAKPFMGFLYVVAEFEESDYSESLGDTFHFWLQTGTLWEANKIYKLGDVVIPSEPNGLAYEATRLGAPFPAWAPNVQRAIGDKIEPTVYNDYFYTVVDTLGDSPRSGTVEPAWPTSDGAQVFEDVNGIQENTPTTPSQPGVDTPNAATQDRYNPDLLPG